MPSTEHPNFKTIRKWKYSDVDLETRLDLDTNKYFVVSPEDNYVWEENYSEQKDAEALTRQTIFHFDEDM